MSSDAPRITEIDYSEALNEDSLTVFREKALHAMARDGVVLIKNALDGNAVEQILYEMRPFIETTPHGLHGLAKSRRVGALVARSPASHRAIEHPEVLTLCEAILGRQQLGSNEVRLVHSKPGEGRYPWRLSLTQLIDVGPGQEQQGVHRGNGLWLHDFSGSSLDPQVETMWALTDFTEENGATHVIPGSHRWRDVVKADKPDRTVFWFEKPTQKTVQAIMPKGSVLVWTGWTLHGAGANATNMRRVGMNIDYSLAFLAQEENQFLACPPEIARTLGEDTRRLIGYTQYGGALNYFADCLRPKVALRQDYDVAAPGAHGMNE